MKTTFRFALVAALLGMSSSAALAADCLKLSVAVKHAVAAKPAEVLQIVEKEVAANSSCACEVVKAAIEGAEADAKVVASIVETAATVAPDQMRLISQCAVAVAPDALTDVQMVMARIAPGQGEVAYSGKEAPASKAPIDVAPAWNPLNFPGQGIGPNPGGPGGAPVIPPGPPLLYPPIVVPPVVIPPIGTDSDFDLGGSRPDRPVDPEPYPYD